MQKKLLVLAACLFAAGLQSTSTPSQGMSHTGVVILKATQGNNVQGTLRINETPPKVHIVGEITGLSPGKHGFHIHEKGDCSAPDAASAGGHFNPDHTMHGAPDAAEHHTGDLGNIVADSSGKAQVDMTVDFLELAVDPKTIDGKAVIVHAGEDDLHSQPAGNAGARVACGVIQKKS